MLAELDGFADPGVDLVTEAAQGRDTRRIMALVVVTFRGVVVVPLTLAVVDGVHLRAYTSGWLAALTYAVVVAWGVAFVVLTLRRGGVPGWLALVDVTVTSCCMVAISYAVHPWFFASVSNSDLEPAMFATGVVVAVACSPVVAVGGCVVLAAAHVVADLPAMAAARSDIVDTASDLAWLVAAALMAGLVVRRLLRADADVRAATRQVVALREQLAEDRGRAQERIRHFRLLHDGPMSFANAVASGGLDHLGLAGVKQQCAIKVDQWRGLSSEGSSSALTDLTLALTAVGDEFAVYGLQVVYQFGDVPADLPLPVVEALGGACREALNNIVAHADVDHAVVTAVTDGPAVVVTIVDQGTGFDPATIPPDRGLTGSIVHRLREVGGVATVDSYPGEGTQIELRWRP